MAFTVQSSVGSSMAAATGRPGQGHLQWAVNQGAYWCFYLSSTASLSAAYSTNGGSSWTAPTGSPFSLIGTHNSEGRNLATGYANIASTDVLHVRNANYTSGNTDHSRFTLGSTWTNTNAEAAHIVSNRIGEAVALDSTGLPVVNTPGTGSSAAAYRASNTDSGTSWTAGFGGATGYYNTGPWCSSFVCVPTGSGDMMVVTDNGNTSTTFTQLEWVHWNGSAWTSVSTVFGSTVTAADTNAWGAVGRTTSDVHVVALSDNTSAYTHARYNGTSWSAGDSIPTLAYGTTSGVSLVSDGTNVWAAAIDTSKNIKYVKWVSGTGWGSWTTLEAARTNTPAYIAGVYSPSRTEIMWIWTENTGSNYDIIGSTLSTGGAPAVVPTKSLFVRQAVNRASTY